MRLPVQLNTATKEAEIKFMTAAGFDFLARWRESLGGDTDPVRTDAVDFAMLACKRFSAHSPLECYARRVADIGDHIKNNPACEVASLVALTCNWFPDSEIIGLAHFRRTWSNNLVLDYLTVHPLIAKPLSDSQNFVRGAGTALLFFLSSIGRELSCGYIWGEATQN